MDSELISFPIGFQWMFKVCWRESQCVSNGFGMGSQFIFNGCSMVVEWTSMHFQLMVRGISMGFQSVFNRLWSDFQLVFNGCSSMAEGTISEHFQCRLGRFSMHFNRFPMHIQWVWAGSQCIPKRNLDGF